MRPKKTILCVDDNEQVLSVRTFLLETRGYRVIAVNSAQQALDIVHQSAPGSLDLLLCDLLMPRWMATNSFAAPSSFTPAFRR